MVNIWCMYCRMYTKKEYGFIYVYIILFSFIHVIYSNEMIAKQDLGFDRITLGENTYTYRVRMREIVIAIYRDSQH